MPRMAVGSFIRQGWMITYLGLPWKLTHEDPGRLERDHAIPSVVPVAPVRVVDRDEPRLADDRREVVLDPGADARVAAERDRGRGQRRVQADLAVGERGELRRGDPVADLVAEHGGAVVRDADVDRAPVARRAVGDRIELRLRDAVRPARDGVGGGVVRVLIGRVVLPVMGALVPNVKSVGIISSHVVMSRTMGSRSAVREPSALNPLTEKAWAVAVLFTVTFAPVVAHELAEDRRHGAPVVGIPVERDLHRIELAGQGRGRVERGAGVARVDVADDDLSVAVVGSVGGDDGAVAQDGVRLGESDGLGIGRGDLRS